MAEFEYRNVTELEGKRVLITKAEKDNIEIDLDGEKFFIVPLCRTCEYNDEVLIFGKCQSD